MSRTSWRPLTPWLERAPSALFTLYAASAAFATYFCMYAFRKPFAAARFEGLQLWSTGVDLKTAFVISQILGYTLSKYVGIKVCSELTSGRRATALAALIATALAALLLFGALPDDYKVLAIFLNGIPLGMVWGMVVSYLEGRRTSEILLAGLSCSFILASGAVKDVGRYLMSGWAVSEGWMPFYTGLLFLLPFMIAVWLLDQVPPPTADDVALRVKREPMDGKRRVQFVKDFAFGLSLLLLMYVFLTAYRDFRDNFAVEILAGLGYGDMAAIFTRTELPVAIGVLMAMAALNLIKDNRRGLLGALGVMLVGVLMLGGGTLLFDAGVISGMTWMIGTGLGAFLTYVPFNSVLFDRMIAATGTTGTAVFAIYLADSLGYSGSIAAQLLKDLLVGDMSRLVFFRGFTFVMAGLGAVSLVGAAWYFYDKTKPATPKT